MRFIRRCSARLCRAILLLSCFSVTSSLATIAAQQPVILIVIAASVAFRYRRHRQSPADSHGSASWAGMATLARNHLLGDDGLILGRANYAAPLPRWRAFLNLLSPGIRSDIACSQFYHAFFMWRWGSPRLIRLQRMIHAATFAPAGKGKGVAVLIPNLLSHRGSVVVTDPKGELAVKTAKHRCRRFSHRVITLDPYHIAGNRSDSINPLSAIDPDSDSFLDDCRDLANALVMRQGTEHEPHWNDMAELVLCAFIALTCAYEKNPRLRNLQMVRQLVSSREAFVNAVSLMRQFDGCKGVVARLGNQIGWLQDKELNSVLTHVQRHTNFLDSVPINNITQESSFHPMDLRSGKVSVYLILPPERLVTLAPLMRMWLSFIIRGLTRGQQASEANPVIFFLDEAAHLGKLQIIEDAVTLMRGYGIRLWFFFQSIDQLNKCFGEHAPTILDNLDTQQYFGISSYEAAEELSKRLGETTIVLTSSSHTEGNSTPTGHGTSGPTPGTRSSSSTVSYSLTGRRLAFANELITAGDDFVTILHRNMPPIPGRLVRHYEAKEFRWGGTGKQGGVGLLGLAAAASIMLASLMLPRFAAEIAPIVRNSLEQPSPMAEFDGQPGSNEAWYPPASYRPMPYRPPIRNSRRYGGMGVSAGYSR